MDSHALNSRVKTIRQTNEVQTGPVVTIVVTTCHLSSYSSSSSELRQLTEKESEKYYSVGVTPS